MSGVSSGGLLDSSGKYAAVQEDESSSMSNSDEGHGLPEDDDDLEAVTPLTLHNSSGRQTHHLSSPHMPPAAPAFTSSSPAGLYGSLTVGAKHDAPGGFDALNGGITSSNRSNHREH